MLGGVGSERSGEECGNDVFEALPGAGCVMIHAIAKPSTLLDPQDIILAAARCWREARDLGLPVQPRLARALAAGNRVILAPVLDSLLFFYEAALGRPFRSGSTAPSEDELVLVSLLEGSDPKPCIVCEARAAEALCCAVCSTRVMMTLAESDPKLTVYIGE